jgi:hypothetical protein
MSMTCAISSPTSNWGSATSCAKIGSALLQQRAEDQEQHPGDQGESKCRARATECTRAPVGGEQLAHGEGHDAADHTEDDGQASPQGVTQARGSEGQRGVPEGDPGEAQHRDRREHVEDAEAFVAPPGGTGGQEHGSAQPGGGLAGDTPSRAPGEREGSQRQDEDPDGESGPWERLVHERISRQPEERGLPEQGRGGRSIRADRRASGRQVGALAVPRREPGVGDSRHEKHFTI